MEVKESSPTLDPGDTAPDGRSSPRVRRRRRTRLPTRRGLAERLTASTVIGLVAALLAFVLIALLLRDRREMVTVAVAAERIPAGTTITESMVDPVEVPASSAVVDGLVRFDDLGELSVAARTVQAGEPLARSALGSRDDLPGSRVMAIPVKSWQAAGGELDVGDQVDVIDTGESGPRYVLAGSAVVGRAADDAGGGLVASTSGDLWVSVEVSAAEALELASVITSDEFVLVRSTGASDEPSPLPAETSGSTPTVTPEETPAVSVPAEPPATAGDG